MPKSKKRPAKSGTKSLLSNVIQPKKQSFDPNQSRLPKGLKNQASKGGKPKLFPGRTGGR
jgi:hypothetical protein